MAFPMARRDLIMDKIDIMEERLTSDEYSRNFADIKPVYSALEAKIETSRCLYCEAAPCINACPTSINIPSFINRIASDNIDGAAQTILDSNILGGSCARVCPTEILCEQACVRNREPECAPVNIGRLQRYAIDHRTSLHHPFSRDEETGKHIAVVGAGPAGLACAHALARKGHQIALFDAKEKSGGLNEYGIARYKLVDDYARQEVDFVLGIGGIEQKHGVRLGKDLQLDDLRNRFDAVFLGLGLGGSNRLGIPGENLKGVEEATVAIEQIRQSNNLKQIAAGRRVVIIGAGNTAIDIACQMKRLGSDEVTLVYRRGKEQMSATRHEQAFARDNGVRILTWANPVELLGSDGHVCGVRLEKTFINDHGALAGTGQNQTLEADFVYKAIGQHFLADCLSDNEAPTLSAGRINIDHQFKTSLENVWAGGDCTNRDEDLTVQAVEHGKQAAQSIHHFLQTQTRGDSSHG